MSQPNTSAPQELDDTTTLAEACGVYDPFNDLWRPPNQELEIGG